MQVLENWRANYYQIMVLRMMKYMQGMSVQDAMKLGFAQNPYGAMGAAFNGINGVMNAFSDECCKKFASRKVFK